MPKECDFIKVLSEISFRIVALLFSALLLILSLLNSINLTAQGEKLRRLSEERENIKQENSYLLSEYESRYSIQNVESYAREVLGCRPCSPEQIIYIELPDEG